ncbi:MAG: cytochrome c, partial [Cytophagales bacterium]|nr:cytochrome c [Cytophagales bacterium]
KKSNKVLAGLSLFILIYVYGVAETKSLTMKKEKITVQVDTTATTSVETPAASDSATSSPTDAIVDANASTQLANAQAIYTQVCKQCHGEDGALARFGASNLQVTQLTKEQIALVITKGRGAMGGYEGQLSEAEISSLADFVVSLKK